MLIVALSLVSLVAPVRAQGNVPPTISLQIRSFDAVLENVKLLVSLSGREEIAKQVEGLIKTKIGPKGLEGIDPDRPFGVYAQFGKELNDVSGVIMVPIADQNAFLGLLENLGVKAKKDFNTGIYTITPTKEILNMQLFFRFANKYVYGTSLNVDALSDKNILAPPACSRPGRSPRSAWP